MPEEPVGGPTQTEVVTSGDDHQRVSREVFGEPGEPLPHDRLLTIARVIHGLEADPYGDQAAPIRLRVIAWLIESPDVSVQGCPFFIGARTAEDANSRSMQALSVAAQRNVPAAVYLYTYMAGMAAHLIERPGLDPRSAEVQVAGIESMLRVYDITMERQMAEPIGSFEELRERRDQGELLAWYETHIRCGGPGSAEP